MIESCNFNTFYDLNPFVKIKGFYFMFTNVLMFTLTIVTFKSNNENLVLGNNIDNKTDIECALFELI